MGRLTWLTLGFLLVASGTPAQAPDSGSSGETSELGSEPITVIPRPPPADPLKVALGERLFADRRLSHDGALACSSCHDVSTNGAGKNMRTTPKAGSAAPLNVPTVFNAALSFRLNWEGNVRTLEAQAEASLADPANMASSIAEVLSKLNADPRSVTEFGAAYGRPPDRANLLDAIAS